MYVSTLYYVLCVNLNVPKLEQLSLPHSPPRGVSSSPLYRTQEPTTRPVQFPAIFIFMYHKSSEKLLYNAHDHEEVFICDAKHRFDNGIVQ